MVLSSARGLAFLVRGLDLEVPARSTGSPRRSVPMLHAFATESSSPISSLVQVTPVPELSLTAVKLSHDGTGAQYLHLAREERWDTWAGAPYCPQPAQWPPDPFSQKPCKWLCIPLYFH